MNDHDKTKKQLISDLTEARQQIFNLQQAAIKLKAPAEDKPGLLKFLKPVFENFPFGIVYLDNEFRIISSNRFFDDFSGLKGEELQGKYCYEVVGEYSDDPAKKGLEKKCSFCKKAECFDSRKPTVIERPFRDKFIRVTTIPELDEKGDISCFMEIVEDFTERRQVEELIKNISRFPSENPNPVLRIDSDQTVLYRNEAFYKLLKESGLSDNDTFRILPENIGILIDKALKKKEPFYMLEVNSGSKVYSYNLIPIAEKGYVNLYGRDITRRKNAEEEILKASEELERKVERRTADLKKINIQLGQEIAERKHAEDELKVAIRAAEDEREKSLAIIAAIGDGIIIQDTDYKVIYENTIQQELIGNHVGEYCYKAYEGKDGVCEGCPVELTYNDGKIHRAERTVAVNGNIAHFELISSPLRDATGKIIAGVKMVRDITKQRKAEETLQKEKEKLQKYLDISAVIVVMIDGDQRVTLINKKGCEILGYERDEIIGKNWFDNFLPERDSDKMKNLHSKLMAGEAEPVEYFENRVLTKQGVERLIAWYNTVFRDDAGNIIATLGAGGDITEHKKTEIALKISEEQFRGAFETAAIGIALVSTEGHWLRVNPALCKIVGYTEQELLSLTFQDITHPEDLEADLKYVKKMLDGAIQFYHMEKRYIHKEGHIVWILLSVSLVRDEKDRPHHFISQIQDITERKKAEKQIRQSLEEKEVLLQEIHHRVKNNMTVISSLLKLQADQIKNKHYRGIFDDSIGRINMMAFIHEKLYRSQNLANINLNDYIKDIIDSIYVSYGVNTCKVTLKTDVEGITLGINTAIPCGLIINELVSNSLKYAFPDEKTGEIRVAVRTSDINDLELTVGDNGIGIPEELDFRNTETLGLTLVNTLTRQLQGEIELHNEHGAEFQIRFRRHD